MLQSSDETYIAQVVMPFTFKLVNGRVLVDVPEGMMSELRDGNGTIVRKPHVTTFSQDHIEKRVSELKRLKKRSEMASNFTGELTLLDDVLRQHAQRTGNDRMESFANDPEIGPWLAWRDDMLAQCEKAAKVIDIKLPKWPKFPKEHRPSDGSKALAKSLGHGGPLDTNIP
jgi:hypothetical protein